MLVGWFYCIVTFVGLFDYLIIWFQITSKIFVLIDFCSVYNGKP